MTETDQFYATSGKKPLEWAWEFHKNCDQLMHQRVAAFIAAQAMTLVSFTALTVARFQQGMMPERAAFVDLGRYTIIGFGLLLAGFGYLVTWPMLLRLNSLNEKYLLKIPEYEFYIKTVESAHRPRLLRLYRNIIPICLPLSQAALWVILLTLTVTANLKAPLPANPSGSTSQVITPRDPGVQTGLPNAAAVRE